MNLNSFSNRSPGVLKHFCFLFFMQLGLASNASVSTASFQLSGRVPEILSLKTETLIETLDLRPGRVNNTKLIGEIGLRVNTDIAGIVVSSSTSSGVPENLNSEPYKFSKPFLIKVNHECQIFAKSAFTKGLELKPNGVDIRPSFSHLQSEQAGLEETCELSATWGSSGLDSLSKLRTQNEYSMNIIVSVVSL